jgi:hypothetical protein
MINPSSTLEIIDLWKLFSSFLRKDGCLEDGLTPITRVLKDEIKKGSKENGKLPGAFV